MKTYEGKILNMIIERGIQKALKQAPVVKPFLSLQEAEEKFGKRILKKWIKEGLVKPINVPGYPIRIDVVEISEIPF